MYNVSNSDPGCGHKDYCTVYPVASGFEYNDHWLVRNQYQLGSTVGITPEICDNLGLFWKGVDGVVDSNDNPYLDHCGGIVDSNPYVDQNVIGWQDMTCHASEWAGDGDCGMFIQRHCIF